MKAIRIKHQGCSARGTSRVVVAGGVVEIPDLPPSRRDARYYRHIGGGIAVRYEGRDYDIIEHPQIGDIEKALTARPFGGGE